MSSNLCSRLGIARAMVFGAVLYVWTSPAAAYLVRCRFVDPANGNTPYPDVVNALPGHDYRIRVQIGVFFDEGDAAGGVLAWNVGRIESAQGTLRRTPGRLAPFTFTPAPPGNGMPAEDPFFALTDIDAAVGLQSMPWIPGQEQPQPVIRGYESYVSVFEFTAPVAADQQAGFSIRIRGNVPVASTWFLFGTPIPPEDGEPGLVVYAPALRSVERIDRTIEFRIVPGMTSAMGWLGVLAWGGRRRR